MNKKLIWGIVIVIVVIAGIVYLNLSTPLCWPYCKNMTDKDREKIKESVTADWKIFTDTEYGFSFKYPSNLYVNKSSYGGSNGWWFITQEKTAPVFDHDDSCGTSKAYINVLATKDFTTSGINKSADQVIGVVEYNFKNSGGKKISDETIDGVRKVKFEGRRIDDVVYEYHVMIFKEKNNINFFYSRCGGGIIPLNEIASTLRFTSTTSQPSVTVLSPNGGEKLVMNSNSRISWKNSNKVNGGSVYLSPKGKEMEKNFVVDRFAYKGVAYDWIVGEIFNPDFTKRVKVSSGDYKIGICLRIETPSIKEECDWSDNYFTITN